MVTQVMNLLNLAGRYGTSCGALILKLANLIALGFVLQARVGYLARDFLLFCFPVRI